MRLSDFPVRRAAYAAAAFSVAAAIIAGPAAAQPSQEARLRAIEARLSALEARLSAGATTSPAAAPAAAGASVAGSYGTDYGGMTLNQSGVDVEGNYDLGRISGRMEGNVLKGYWLKGGDGCRTEVMGTRNWGRLEFRFDPARQRFLGFFSYCEALPTSAWNGQRR